MQIACENYLVNVEGRVVREFASGAEAVAHYHNKGFVSANIVGADRIMVNSDTTSAFYGVEIYKRGLLDWIAVEQGSEIS